MADYEAPEADALEQALPPVDADLELIDVDEGPEIGTEAPGSDAVWQARPGAVPAAVARRPLPYDAPENDVIDQRLSAGGDDDDDEFR